MTDEAAAAGVEFLPVDRVEPARLRGLWSRPLGLRLLAGGAAVSAAVAALFGVGMLVFWSKAGIPSGTVALVAAVGLGALARALVRGDPWARPAGMLACLLGIAACADGLLALRLGPALGAVLLGGALLYLARGERLFSTPLADV